MCETLKHALGFRNIGTIMVIGAYLIFFGMVDSNTFQLAFLEYSADFSYGLKAEEDIPTLQFEGYESKTP